MLIKKIKTPTSITITIQNLLARFNVRIVRISKLQELYDSLDLEGAKRKWSKAPKPKTIEGFVYNSLGLLESRSQLQQDLIALYIHSVSTSNNPGYFVEFGASDGITYSNTYLLEKSYGWDGVLAEPARLWNEQLRENRHCKIETRCVWKNTGSVLEFNEVESAGEYSTLDLFSKSDSHSSTRTKGTKYKVKTISLLDLLIENRAPECISYLSIDTEGSEYEILSGFDFSKYKFQFITVEHNFAENRLKIKKLLNENGYSQILEEYSQWDDWYVPTEISLKLEP